MKGLLAYNPDTDRIGVLRSDLWEIDGLHCGQTLRVEIDGEWVNTRIEMNGNNEWYLVGTNIVGNDSFLYLTVELD